jgi:hypothetical protein
VTDATTPLVARTRPIYPLLLGALLVAAALAVGSAVQRVADIGGSPLLLVALVPFLVVGSLGVGSLVRQRAELRADGTLTVTLVRTVQVDLGRLRTVRATPRTRNGWALILEDDRGGRVRLPSNVFWDRKREVWTAVLRALERGPVPVAGRTLLQVAREARIRGRLQVVERPPFALPLPYEARLAPQAVTVLAAVLMVPLAFSAAEQAGGVRLPLPVPLPPVWAVAAVALVLVARQATRRLRIAADGRMTADGLLLRRELNLSTLRRVRTLPARRLSLEDAEGHTLTLPLNDRWGPAGPLFARVLTAARTTGATIDAETLRLLRETAGEAFVI